MCKVEGRSMKEAALGGVFDLVQVVVLAQRLQKMSRVQIEGTGFRHTSGIWPPV